MKRLCFGGVGHYDGKFRPNMKSTPASFKLIQKNRLEESSNSQPAFPSFFTVVICTLPLIKHLESQLGVFSLSCVAGSCRTRPPFQGRWHQSSSDHSHMKQVSEENCLFAASQSLALVTRLMAMALVWEVGVGKPTSALTHRLLKDWFLRGRNASHSSYWRTELPSESTFSNFTAIPLKVSDLTVW